MPIFVFHNIRNCLCPKHQQLARLESILLQNLPTILSGDLPKLFLSLLIMLEIISKNKYVPSKYFSKTFN